LEGLDLGDVLI